jgi:acyl carrier protein
MTINKENLITYVQTELNVDEPIAGDTELFSTGMLDSVSMVGLISYIEDKGHVNVQPSDVTLDNFDTIDAILEYIENRG